MSATRKMWSARSRAFGRTLLTPVVAVGNGVKAVGQGARRITHRVVNMSGTTALTMSFVTVMLSTVGTLVWNIQFAEDSMGQKYKAVSPKALAEAVNESVCVRDALADRAKWRDVITNSDLKSTRESCEQKEILQGAKK